MVNVWKMKTNMGINKARPLCGYEKTIYSPQVMGMSCLTCMGKMY